MFAAGDLVVYGGEGVCRVESIGPSGLAYDDGTRLYYHLTPLYRSGTVMTPVDTGVLMRSVITREEALDSFLSRDVCSYREIVFCGYGEPTYRLDDILWLVDQLKERFGRRLPPVRINTNGHANLILGRDVVPELKGRIDTLSISLNAVTAAEYTALCHPAQGEAAYQAMLDFAREATRYVPHVVLTIVDKDKSSEEIETCRQIAAELGVKLRIRSFIDS